MKTDSVVLSLFGQSVAAPQYAIHEEDRLEWIHALLSEAASIPEWLNYQLKNQPMLFIGCEIPDWFGRFLLRYVEQTPTVDGEHAVLLRRLLNLTRTVVAFDLS